MTRIPRSNTWYGTQRQFASTLFMATLALLSLMLTVVPTTAQQPSWTKLSSNNPPPARHGHELVYHSKDSVTVLFGGKASSGLLADTWLWNGLDWVEETSLTRAPGKRENHAMCSFGSASSDSVLLFGGQNALGQLDDLWVWSGSAWQQRSKGGTWPTKRRDAGLAHDTVRNVAVLFGGFDQPGLPAAQTWEWNGSTWNSHAAQAGGPAPRWGHKMGWDPVGKVVLLFGGVTSSGVRLTDTWAWDGSTWTNLATTGPTGSLEGGMASDVDGGSVVYFGGRDLTRAWNETWEWHDATKSWSQVTTAVVPAARSNFGMVYDKARRSTIVFAGEAGLSDDLWEYGFPALTIPFGTGCASTANPPIITSTIPHLGGTVTLSVEGFKPNQVGQLIFGSSNTVWGSHSLPLSLGIIGAANCNLYASIDVTQPITINPLGHYTSPPLSLPSSASLLGERYYLQAYATDSASNPVGLATTNALKLVLGQLHRKGSWQVLPNSPLAPYYHHDDIFFIDEKVGWVCNISGEIWKTTDGGDHWKRVWNNPGAAFRTLTFVDAMTGWVGNLGLGGWSGGISDPNVLFSTTDGGLTWTAVTNISGPLPNGICGLQAIGPKTIHGAGRYAGQAYFISSRDGGVSWVSQKLSARYDAFVDVLFFTPERGYITSSNSRGNAALLYTTDAGASWTTVITNNAYHYWKIGFASPTFGYGVCWSGRDADKWIQTYDSGKTWTSRKYAGNFEANGIGFLNEQTGWVGGHEKYTYGTTDGGTTWNSFQIDTVYGDYINKFLRVSNTVVYAVGNRIYKYSDDHGHSEKLGGFDNSLCKLAVTASAGTATITYTVPEDDNVQITIYERGGIIHRRPLDKRQQAGNYTINVHSQDKTKVLYASIVTGRYRQKVRFINHR